MRVVIAGAGNVGTSIARDLVAGQHDVLLIEEDPDVIARARTLFDAAWMEGDACEVSTLRTAELDRADVLVAATGDDKANLVSSLLAKTEFAVPRVVARINHPANQWLFNESWGVDVSVSTPSLLTALVEEAVSVGALVRLLQFNGGDAHLVEVRLASTSPAANRPLSELAVPRDASVVAIVRNGNVVIPRGDTVMAVGDEVVVLVNAGSEDTVKSLLVGV
jgi:trk system potassium uptake protein TrkA